MRGTLLPLLSFAVVALGCNEQSFTAKRLNSIAVTAGDFDQLGAPLDRMNVRHTVYEGLISTATWDPDYEGQNMALKVEALFGDLAEISGHDALFVASGTRGLGERVYNGLLPDDALVTDPAVVENVQEYVKRGGVVLFTDWTYDLLEAAWPDYVDFLNEDAELDAAQVGEIGTVTATVMQTELESSLEVDKVALKYDFSNWSVVESVSEDVTVWLAADARYRVQEGGVMTLADSPMLLSFEPKTGGRVIYASFHMDAQTAVVTDQMLRTVVGYFEEGNNEEDEEEDGE
jgi:hypothetical protein